MEFASTEGMNNEVKRVRAAVGEDARAITRLLRQVPYSHVHADWHLPVDWLGSPGFVVMPEPAFRTEQRRSVASKLLPPRTRLQGCLAVAADPPPAAWVRVASIAAVHHPKAVLAAMLAQVVEFLRQTAVSELGWLAMRDWPNGWLPGLGFVLANEIETYVKEDMSVPRVTAVPNLKIRPAHVDDMNALEQIEAASFEPLWRHSGATLTLAARQALCFDVAEWGEQVVGFQLSAKTGKGAHLVRLTVAPDLQQHGIGSVLLAHAINTYRQAGLRQITLNTQVNNIPSQLLYKKFGFYASGQRLPIWVKVL